MNLSFLSHTELFEGIGEGDIKSLLQCLQATEKTVTKGEVIFHAGTCISEIGLIETGSANMVIHFYQGYERIFGHFHAGEVIGENYAILSDHQLPGDLIATQKSVILFLNLQRLMTTCASCCKSHQALILNLLKIAAKKNLMLSDRMLHTASKSLRERLLSYLCQQALLHQSNSFAIPFDRQQLADYLGVDRSAMSAELGKMKKEGLLSYRKNEFLLKTRGKDH